MEQRLRPMGQGPHMHDAERGCDGQHSLSCNTADDRQCSTTDEFSAEELIMTSSPAAAHHLAAHGTTGRFPSPWCLMFATTHMANQCCSAGTGSGAVERYLEPGLHLQLRAESAAGSISAALPHCGAHPADRGHRPHDCPEQGTSSRPLFCWLPVCLAPFLCLRMLVPAAMAPSTSLASDSNASLMPDAEYMYRLPWHKSLPALHMQLLPEMM